MNSGQQSAPLEPEASIQAALGLFEQHMVNEGFANNTIKAFASDIRLLGGYLGLGQPIGKIGTNNLNDFLNWLVHDRGKPCSPKSYARRVTTLKVFFGWLHKSGVLSENPANKVIQQSVTSPLPTVPTESEIDRALMIARELYLQEKSADARPYMLLTLLLKTGVKKAEATNVSPNHIHRDEPTEPFLFIRYKNPRQRYKERKLSLDEDWLPILDAYIAQYPVKDKLFTCTARNLEYVLHDIAATAEIDKGKLSFENLRWFAALQDYRQGVEHDSIRQKLGISKITWRETRNKLEKIDQQQKAGDTPAE